MAIRWNAIEASNRLDEIEELANQARPILYECMAKCLAFSKADDFPQYLTQYAHTMGYKLEYTISNLSQSIQKIREHIPADELEKQKKRGGQLSLTSE